MAQYQCPTPVAAPRTEHLGPDRRTDKVIYSLKPEIKAARQASRAIAALDSWAVGQLLGLGPYKTPTFSN